MGENHKDCVYTSPAPGRARLRFRYWNVIDGMFVQDEAVQAITSVNPPLLVDYNRDGSVDAEDILLYVAGRLAYFWRNDDTWKDDDAFASSSGLNASDGIVNGRCDLINFLPVAVDVGAFATNWNANAVYYRLEADSVGMQGAKIAFADVDWARIGETPFGTDRDIHGNYLHSAPVSALGAWTNLPPAFVSRTLTGSSTLLMEFPSVARYGILRLKVYSKADDHLLFSSAISLHVGDVGQMVGWSNLRSVAGGSGGVPTRLTTPDWPAEAHEPGTVVFVHGYNMEEDEETPLWAKNVFKKLWWSGMDAGFTAVLWRGNESQMWIPGENCYATRNYHQNVLNAFRTADAFASRVNADIPGARKYMIAHSLGNMLVSAARQFHGLQYERYFMLNAAVPVEAYDPAGGVTDEAKTAMTPAEWLPYPDRVRSTHWYELFLGAPGDARQGLTWKGLFKDVDNTVNFYSSRDEVVANGDGGWKWPLTRKFAWYNQERERGSYLVSFSPQAGWEFSGHYVKEEFVGIQNGMPRYSYRKYTPEETSSIADTNLMVRPFFKDFSDEQIYGEGGSAFLQSNDMVRWYALSHGIPVESFAAGANPVPKWGASVQGNALKSKIFQKGVVRNINMAVNCIRTGRKVDELPWIHSYFIENSLFDTTVLYDALVKQIGTTKAVKDEK